MLVSVNLTFASSFSVQHLTTPNTNGVVVGIQRRLENALQARVRDPGVKCVQGHKGRALGKNGHAIDLRINKGVEGREEVQLRKRKPGREDKIRAEEKKKFYLTDITRPLEPIQK